ncbi:uncharacterized protein MKK02DRAFT_30384 [Dioszegia hungarica]|uniref:Uncharacterized protein n=1 Tax=Dioszegia hungarica TaxID=4972 RepID=A0AA38H2C1_9TREE|nr:uncharacterized protein MKK02DRAFT_30384 [Dioszegia hungarica]KAI9632617.1 hypothetical protein MKK02DRAFT_30384 [Dioszegia hungarica]
MLSRRDAPLAPLLPRKALSLLGGNACIIHGEARRVVIASFYPNPERGPAGAPDIAKAIAARSLGGDGGRTCRGLARQYALKGSQKTHGEGSLCVSLGHAPYVASRPGFHASSRRSCFLSTSLLADAPNNYPTDLSNADSPQRRLPDFLYSFSRLHRGFSLFKRIIRHPPCTSTMPVSHWSDTTPGWSAGQPSRVAYPHDMSYDLPFIDEPRPSRIDPWVSENIDRTREGSLPWMNFHFPPTRSYPSISQAVLTDAVRAADHHGPVASAPDGSRVTGASAQGMERPDLTPDSDTDLDYDSDDPDWIAYMADTKTEQDPKLDYSRDTTSCGSELDPEEVSQSSPDPVSTPLSESPTANTSVPSTSIRRGQLRNADLRKKAKLRERQEVLMGRGVCRTSSSRARDMPLTLVDELIDLTDSAGHKDYKGYAIHQSRTPEGKRTYSFLDPNAALKVAKKIVPLLSLISLPRKASRLAQLNAMRAAVSRSSTSRSDVVTPTTLTAGSEPMRTRLPNASKADQLERNGRRLRNLARAYFILEARGIRRMRRVQSQRVPREFLDALVTQTDSANPQSAVPEYLGLVIHDTAASKHASEPILLDWRETVWTEGDGESVSLLRPWMEKYR